MSTSFCCFKCLPLLLFSPADPAWGNLTLDTPHLQIGNPAGPVMTFPPLQVSKAVLCQSAAQEELINLGVAASWLRKREKGGQFVSLVSRNFISIYSTWCWLALLQEETVGSVPIRRIDSVPWRFSFSLHAPAGMLCTLASSYLLQHCQLN